MSHGKILGFSIFLVLASTSCERSQAATSEVCGSGKLTRAKVTHYYIPRVSSPKDRRCRMEGTCIYLKNGKEMIWNYGRGSHLRSQVQCKYGFGAKNMCITPCDSVAADLRYHKVGSKIFIKSMVGRVCNGKKLDGIFTVADSGGAIKGPNRFDFFLGECKANRSDICFDKEYASVNAAINSGKNEWCPARNPAAAAKLIESSLPNPIGPVEPRLPASKSPAAG